MTHDLDVRNNLYQYFGGAVSLRSPKEIFQKNYFLPYVEVLSTILAICLFFISSKYDKQVMYQALSGVVAVAYAESIVLLFPSSRSWWYEHPLFALSGGYLPFYIFPVYFTMYTYAFVPSKSCRLPKIAQAWLSTLFCMIFIMQCDQFGGTHAMWKYNDSDPSLMDRYFDIPWAEVYMLSLLTFNMTLLSDYFFPIDELNSRIPVRGIFACAAFSGTLSYLEYGICNLILCSKFGGNTMLLGFVIPLVVTSVLSIIKPDLWTTYMQSAGHSPIKKFAFVTRFLSCVTLVIAAFMVRPEIITGIGPHQPIGPCHSREIVLNQIFAYVERDQYFCISEENELSSYNFNCLNKDQLSYISNKTIEWYPICGKPIENKTNFVTAAIIAAVINMFLVHLTTYTFAFKPKKEAKKIA